MELQDFWNKFAKMNTRQMQDALTRKVKTYSLMRRNVRNLLSREKEALGRFAGIVEIRDDCCAPMFEVAYFENNAGKADRVFCIFTKYEVTTVGEKIAYVMRDYDAPFSIYEVEKFCAFFELSEFCKKKMMAEAATSEQYEAWVDYERRTCSW